MVRVSKATYYMDLAGESSNAAITIDNHILGRTQPEDYQTTRKLSESLYKIVRQHNPTNMFLIGDVIWKNREDWNGKTLEDTKLHAWLFAKDLETFAELSRERQEELRGACLDLSRAAQGYSIPRILRLVA